MWEDGGLWAGASEDALVLRRCAACATLCQPPLPMCPHCRSVRWRDHLSPGDGRILGWLCSAHPTRADVPARIVVVVELEEGVRFVSNLIGTALGDVQEGMAVRLCFETIDDIRLPQFRAA